MEDGPQAGTPEPERPVQEHPPVSLVGVALTVITFGAPTVAATAEPKPDLKKLAAEVERLHEEIESLAEQYNGERVRLKAAQRSAAIAKKNLAKSEAELADRRQKASALAQNSYMNGGIGPLLPMVGATDPETYLDQASTTYALQMQQGQEVTEVTNVMKPPSGPRPAPPPARPR